MDNKLFNVNGKSFYQFKKTLDLILTDEYEEEGVQKRFGVIGSGIRGYRITPKKGIILYWYIDNDRLIEKRVKPIEELVEKYDILPKKLRKHKLEKLENKRVTLPIDILTDTLWSCLNDAQDNIDDFEMEDWEENLDHDGSNNKGFRIYVDKWGHIEEDHGMTIDHYTSLAIKPIYCWHGK